MGGELHRYTASVVGGGLGASSIEGEREGEEDGEGWPCEPSSSPESCGDDDLSRRMQTMK
jgi:hypothetical protein